GLLLLTAAIIVAFVPFLTSAPGTPGTQSGTTIAGLEPQILMRMLRQSPAGTPLVTSLIALALLAGLLVSAATALLTAGGMAAAEWIKQSARPTGPNLRHKGLTRMAIGILLFVCLVWALQKPSDPLPLFLLAGAFGVQLLPALLGLCYFKRLSGPAIQDGALAGLLAVFVTSTIPQGIAAPLGLTLPFAAWPLSMHPALWGLLVNLIALFVGSLIDRSSSNSEKSQKILAHQKSWHVLPDGQPIMAPNAGKWRFVALVLLVLFSGAVAVPLVGLSLPGLSGLSLWGWQFVAWLIGLALVYVVAYRLQPTFDPELALDGSPDPLNRRFRVKAKVRKVEAVTPNPVSDTDSDRNDENI
ncbi:MAG: hypothetical protein L3J67_12090, partial [Hyphomicrobiaceae bacterium]|nr:hypothetical protein [Hyphomicrobiaceae bacterium]